MSKQYVGSENRMLIQIVKCNNWIFDKKQRFLYNEETKGQLWQQVSAALAEKGFLLTDPKSRWQKLREHFVRNDKNANYKWPYYEDMKFMLDHIHHRDNASARSAQGSAISTAKEPNESSSSTMHLDMQGLGDDAPDVGSIQELPALTISSCTDLVTNSVQPLEPIADYAQMPSSTSTLESSLHDLNWEHSYAITEVSTSVSSVTVDSIPAPDCTTEENSRSCTEDLMESAVPSTIENYALNVEYAITPPTISRTNLIANASSAGASHAKQSPVIALSGSSSASQRAAPLVHTPIGKIRNTNQTNRVAESPCASSTHSVTPKTSKVGHKRSAVVPPLDPFAKKRKEAAGKSDATEDAIVGCSNDLRTMSSEFTDLLRLKKKLLEAQLQKERIDVGIPQTSHMVESTDGYFQLLQNEWAQLPTDMQDELFPHMLDIMEEYETQ